MRKNYLLALIFATSLFYYPIIAKSMEGADFKTEIKSKKTIFSLDSPSIYSGKTGATKPKKNVFGMDFGIGSLSIKRVIYLYPSYSPVERKYSSPVFAAGFRYMHRFNPYISADFVKINFNCPFRVGDEMEMMNLQLMTGIRGNTPTFLKSMSGYTAIRMGYSLYFIDDFVHGIAFETEIGLHLTPTVFIAFSYNLNTVFPYIFYSDPISINVNTYALRVGFNF